uniref:Uncharacterized protein n=1 Tax=Opuntia streptacantha TaxID=393608 RepID=A0A7C8ZKQ8_OPUST
MFRPRRLHLPTGPFFLFGSIFDIGNSDLSSSMLKLPLWVGTESRTPAWFTHTIRAPLPRTLPTLPLSGASMPWCFGPCPVQIPFQPFFVLFFRWEVALFLRYHIRVSGGMAGSGMLPCLALQEIVVSCFGQSCFA